MKIIEFVGMPRAGKTTQINRLTSHLEAKGFRVAVVTDRDRAESIHISPTEGLAYTLVFFSMAVEAVSKYASTMDYLLIDRGFNDAAVWADVRFTLGEIDEKERDALKTIFKRFARTVDRTFYFTASVEIGLERHEQTEHLAVDEVAMNRKWLETLQTSYAKNSSGFIRSVVIDGEQDSDIVTQEVLKYFE